MRRLPLLALPLGLAAVLAFLASRPSEQAESRTAVRLDAGSPTAPGQAKPAHALDPDRVDEREHLARRQARKDPSQSQPAETDQPAAGSTPAALVRGRVLGPTGSGLAGARVLLSNAYAPELPLEREDALGQRSAVAVEVVCDSSGHFEVRNGLEARRGLSLVVLAPRLTPYRIQGEWLYPDRPLDLGELRMRPGCSVSGRVVGPSGEGIAATLLRHAPDPIQDPPAAKPWDQGRVPLGHSDEDGRFHLQGLPSGPWQIVALADGWMTSGAQGSLAPLESAQGVRIALERGAAISGSLAGRPPNAPRLQITAAAELGDEPARTAWIDEEGRFAVQGLRRGAGYRLTVAAARPMEGGSLAREPAVPVLPAVAGASDVQLVWHGVAVASGSLVDGLTGQPVEAAELLIRSGEQRLRRLPDASFAGGLVRIEDKALVTKGPLALHIHSPGYRDRVLQLPPLRPGEQRDLGEMALDPGPVLDVSVVDPKGQPIAGAEVRLGRRVPLALDLRAETSHLQERPAWLREGRTDHQGRAQLSVLAEPGPAQAGLLAVFGKGWAPSWSTIQPGQSGPLRIQLNQGADLTIRAFDSQGNFLDGVIVELQRLGPEGWPLHASSTEAGAVTFRRYPPGDYRYRARVEGNAWRPADYSPAAAWRSVELAQGQHAEARLECAGFYDLAGTVEDRFGALAGASLLLLPGDRTQGPWRYFDDHAGRGSRFDVKARGDGSFRFHVINEGPYTLLITHPRRSLATRVLTRVERDAPPLDIQLSTSVLEGQVLLEGGVPAAGAFVSLTEPNGPTQGSVETDDQGRYRLVGVPPDRNLRLRLGGRYLSHGTQDVEALLPDEVRRIDWQQAARGALRIRLLGPHAQQVRVTGRSQNGAHKATMVRPDETLSSLECSGLAPGPWVFEFTTKLPDGATHTETRTWTIEGLRMGQVEYLAD